jgi:hypothetical protein
MTPEQTLNITSLVSSELDFMGQFEMVDQLDAAPSGFSSKCLTSASCLGAIAKANSVDAVFAGAATVSGSNVDLYLVLYDGGRIKRSKEFTIENTPSVIADSMTNLIREVVTGETIQQAVAEERGSFDPVSFEDDEEDDIIIAPSSGVSRRIPTGGGDSDFDDLDDFELDDDPFDEEEARREEEARAEAARREEDARRAEEARRAEAARRAEEARAEAARRAEEARAEAVRQAEEAARLAQMSEPEDEEMPEFNFASSVDSVQEDEDDDGYTQTSYRDDDDDYRSSSSSRSSRPTYDDYDDLDEDSSSGGSNYDYDDLDEDDSSRSSRSSRDSRDSRDSGSRFSSSSSATVQRDPGESTASLIGRLGASKYQDLNFITYGFEVAFMPTNNMAIVAGLEAYSAKRQIPEALLEEGQPSTQWNTILPVNIGAQYRLGNDGLRPYVGGDIVLIPGYVKDADSIATGLRARGGIDFIVTEGFGINLNVSAGFWSGEDFEAVQQDLSANGLVPQLSGGTILRF